MKKTTLLFLFSWSITFAQLTPRYDQTREGHLVFHTIKTDSQGKIIPWYSDDLGKSYSHNISLLWSFWQNIRTD